MTQRALRPLARAARRRLTADGGGQPHLSTRVDPVPSRQREREFLQGKEFIETFILCAHLFAVTTTLRLTPFVLKLPVRPPVLVAKQASSLAHLSGNRLGLGVGLSPWPEDFAALGVPWQSRGRRMEVMDILSGLKAASS